MKRKCLANGFDKWKAVLHVDRSILFLQMAYLVVLRFLFLLLLIFGVTQTAQAELTFPERPPAGHYVVDSGNMIPDADEPAINAIAHKLLAEQQIPLLVVTVTALEFQGAAGMSIEHYAQALFDHWGIGSQDRNYGMLVLVSYLDRRARIEFGAGFANRYNSEAEAIMQDIIVPAFKNFEYGPGLIQAAGALDQVARGLGLPPREIPWLIVIPSAIVGSIFLGFLIHNLFASGRYGWAWALLAFIGIVLVWMLRNGGRGGAFGGGSSGGGGASGSF